MRGADDALVHHLALEHGGLKQGGGGYRSDCAHGEGEMADMAKRLQNGIHCRVQLGPVDMWRGR